MRKIRKVLVTGNNGYIGSVLVPVLVKQGYTVIGLDVDYYGGICRFYEDQPSPVAQIHKDVRDTKVNDFQGVDAVIHLAALSNDPLGELEPRMTEEINYGGTLRVAECASKANVKRFVYVSSQSMYGISKREEEIEEDQSGKNPLTEYARTKWEAECALKQLAKEDFTVICFRPSTVFGASPKLRCDIVFNNLVACAYTTGHIEIKSDGTPWRPVIHIEDVCRALTAGLKAPKPLVQRESFNIGIHNGNFTVRQLAEAARQAVSGCKVVFTGEHGPDARTYRVSFKKILNQLSEYYRPEWSLSKGAQQLLKMFQRVGFSEDDFRGDRTNRLLRLQRLIGEGKLSHDLKWLNVDECPRFAGNL